MTIQELEKELTELTEQISKMTIRGPGWSGSVADGFKFVPPVPGPITAGVQSSGIPLHPILPGACCLLDQSCVVETAAACSAAGGYYHGDGSVCSPSPCCTGSFNLCKCGINAYTGNAVYAVITWSFSGNTGYSQSGTGCPCTPSSNVQSGGPFTTTYDKTTCAHVDSPARPWTFTETEIRCGGSPSTFHPTFVNCNDPCGYLGYPICGHCSTSSGGVPSDCDPITSPTSRGSSFSYECDCTPPSCLPFPGAGCCGSEPCDCTSNGTFNCSGVLSDEYTTAELIANALASATCAGGCTPHTSLSSDEKCVTVLCIG